MKSSNVQALGVLMDLIYSIYVLLAQPTEWIWSICILTKTWFSQHFFSKCCFLIKLTHIQLINAWI